MSNTTSKRNPRKNTPQNRGKKIYVTKHAWYYENDPFDKEKIEAAKQLVQKLEFSQIMDEKSVSEQQGHDEK